MTFFNYGSCPDCHVGQGENHRQWCPRHPASIALQHSEKIWKAIQEGPVKVTVRNSSQPQKLTGGSTDYYKVKIDKPTTPGFAPYTAECNDIIEALGMNFAEGNIFKAIWRMAAQRKGNGKPGLDRLYDAEKVEFFAKRLVAQENASNQTQTR